MRSHYPAPRFSLRTLIVVMLLGGPMLAMLSNPVPGILIGWLLVTALSIAEAVHCWNVPRQPKD